MPSRQNTQRQAHTVTDLSHCQPKALKIKLKQKRLLNLTERLAQFDPHRHGAELMVSSRKQGAEQW